MTTNEPLPTPPTTAEEGVRIWDAKFASADARARPAFLDFGHALLALRREVGGNDTAFNKKLAGLPLKTNDKNIRADAQKLAFQVEAGLRTREDALALPVREVRALPGLTHGEYGLVLKPKVKRVATPKKPKPEAPNEPNLFDTSAPPVEANDMQPVLGDIAPSAAGDDASQVIDQNEAISTNQPEDPANDASRLAGGDDNAAGGGKAKGPDMEDAPAAIVAPFGDGAEIADNGGKADGVDGAANGLVTTTITIPRTRLAHLLTIAHEAVGARTWRKHKTWEAIIADAKQNIVSDRDSSGRSARQRALAEIGQALNKLLTS